MNKLYGINVKLFRYCINALIFNINIHLTFYHYLLQSINFVQLQLTNLAPLLNGLSPPDKSRIVWTGLYTRDPVATYTRDKFSDP